MVFIKRSSIDVLLFSLTVQSVSASFGSLLCLQFFAVSRTINSTIMSSYTQLLFTSSIRRTSSKLTAMGLLKVSKILRSWNKKSSTWRNYFKLIQTHSNNHEIFFDDDNSLSSCLCAASKEVQWMGLRARRGGAIQHLLRFKFAYISEQILFDGMRSRFTQMLFIFNSTFS